MDHQTTYKQSFKTRRNDACINGNQRNKAKYHPKHLNSLQRHHPAMIYHGKKYIFIF